MVEHVKGIMVFSVLCFGAIALVAAFAPAPMGEPASGEEMSLKPPWPFLWLYGLENITGQIDTMYQALALFFLALAVLPLLDRGLERHPRKRKGTLAASAGVLLGIIGLSVYAGVAPPQLHKHDHGSGHPHTQANEHPSPPASDADPHQHDETPHTHD